MVVASLDTNIWGNQHGRIHHDQKFCAEWVSDDHGKHKILGEGSNGQVKLAYKVEGNTRVKLAIKADTSGNDDKFKVEVDAMTHLLKVPNHVVKIYGFEDGTEKLTAMEYLGGGDLWEQCTREAGGCPLGASVANAKKIMKQVVAAVKDCHDHKVAHRDVKEMQFAFVSKPAGNYDTTIKLVDFGEAVRTRSGSRFSNSTSKQLGRGLVPEVANWPRLTDEDSTGTPCWMAPELMTNRKYAVNMRKKRGADPPPETFSVLAPDVWAVGVVAYQVLTGKLFVQELYKVIEGKLPREVLTGNHHFCGRFLVYTETALIQAKQADIKALMAKEQLPAAAKDFVENALTVSADKRPLIGALAEHAWLNA
jgi:serine/threonine protein kinase